VREILDEWTDEVLDGVQQRDEVLDVMDGDVDS
jgi:hypothetical protein